MVLGCEYHGYTSDITRTWPVSGHFKEEQRVLYEIVYQVQRDLLNLLQQNPTLDSMFDSMCIQLGKYLQEINLIPKSASSEEVFKVRFGNAIHRTSETQPQSFPGRLQVLSAPRLALPRDGCARHAHDPAQHQRAAGDGDNAGAGDLHQRQAQRPGHIQGTGDQDRGRHPHNGKRSGDSHEEAAAGREDYREDCWRRRRRR